MKKTFYLFLGLLGILITPAYSEWVFIEHIEETNVSEVDLIAFTSGDFDDYIFIIDMLQQKNPDYNILVQVGYKDSTTAVNWYPSYEGGVSSIRQGQDQMVTTPASYNGIPVTNIANAGTFYIGDLRLSNTGMAGMAVAGSYGPVAFYGTGVIGSDASGSISGIYNGSPPVNSIRFYSENPTPAEDELTTVSMTIYALKQFSESE